MVRLFACLLVAAVALLCSVGDVQAQGTTNQCPASSPAGNFPPCDEGQAYAEAYRQAAVWDGMRADWTKPYGINRTVVGRYDAFCTTTSGGWAGCGSAWYQASRSCSARPAYVGAGPVSTVQSTARNGSISCVDGCDAVWQNNGDGTWTGSYALGQTCNSDTAKTKCEHTAGYHWNAWNQTCEPTEQKCEANQVKDADTGACKEACPEGMVVNQQGQCETAKEECPAGNVKSPEGACLPGEGQCAAGEARRDNGTCGKDANGDGVADEDDDDPDNDPKESFSGGDGCNNPPQCSGSPIMCGQARIQWRIECNTRKNRNVTGGGCSAMPVCTGDQCDAMEYSQLLMQWRSACALEAMTAGGGSGGSDADIAAIKNALTGSVQGDAGEEGSPDGAFSTDTSDPIEVDSTGYGFARSCPQPPTVSVMGQTITFDIAKFCSWVALGGQLVLVMAALLSLRILSSGGSA